MRDATGVSNKDEEQDNTTRLSPRVTPQRPAHGSPTARSILTAPPVFSTGTARTSKARSGNRTARQRLCPPNTPRRPQLTLGKSRPGVGATPALGTSPAGRRYAPFAQRTRPLPLEPPRGPGREVAASCETPPRDAARLRTRVREKGPEGG